MKTSWLTIVNGRRLCVPYQKLATEYLDSLKRSYRPYSDPLVTQQPSVGRAGKDVETAGGNTYAAALADLTRQSPARIVYSKAMVIGESTDELIRSKHEARLDAFYTHPSVSIIPDIRLYHWYHTVDLGGGIVTPGQYDYRGSIGAFPFPQDMRGLTMLEIGSATGFFSFEAERRGATVTSVELPSFHVLDRFPGQSQTRLLRRLAQMRTPHADLESDPLVAMTSAQTYFYHLDGPFQFCYRMVHSKVNRVYSTIYDLKTSAIAGKSFDYVLLGDVLLHLFNPVDALATAASFSRDKLIISQQMPEVESDQPMLHYVGGESLDEDDLCWFLPNLPFFKQFCRKLGFATVDEVGRNQGCLYPSGYRFDRSIILAGR